MTKKLTFENKGRGTHVAFINTPIFRDSVLNPGKRHFSRWVFGAVRVIRESVGAFRIDRCNAVGGFWMPWEPVTDEVFTSSAKAKGLEIEGA